MNPGPAHPFQGELNDVYETNGPVAGSSRLGRRRGFVPERLRALQAASGHELRRLLRYVLLLLAGQARGGQSPRAGRHHRAGRQPGPQQGASRHQLSSAGRCVLRVQGWAADLGDERSSIPQPSGQSTGEAGLCRSRARCRRSIGRPGRDVLPSSIDAADEFGQVDGLVG